MNDKTKKYILTQLVERIKAIKYHKLSSHRFLKNIIKLKDKNKLPNWIYVFYIRIKKEMCFDNNKYFN